VEPSNEKDRNVDVQAYWNKYYVGRTDSATVVPSQFAAFVAGEIGTSARNIVDLGCGNGRDTMFFANLGYLAVGVDASESAIALCQARADAGPPDARGRVTFAQAALPSPGLDTALAAVSIGDPIVVYARFFLHAIEEAVEESLLRAIRSSGASVSAVAVEFRTHRDREQAKSTPAHFRRFIEPADFLRRATRSGFRPTYFVEGFGYAKHAADDAHVARVLLEPV
jgi:SAM-dependent methyltransferase